MMIDRADGLPGSDHLGRRARKDGDDAPRLVIVKALHRMRAQIVDDFEAGLESGVAFDAAGIWARARPRQNRKLEAEHAELSAGERADQFARQKDIVELV